MKDKTYRLMIKHHNITGLKYLCITCRSDWEKYTGSGVNWQRHLKKHGLDIKTEVIYSSKNYDDFLEKCIYYSALYNVALSDQFANAIPEFGYETEEGICQLTLFWQYATDEVKKEIISRRNESIKKNHWTISKDEETKQKIIDTISYKNHKNWSNLSVDARRTIIEKLKAGFRNFSTNHNEANTQWREKISKAVKERFANEPSVVTSERIKLARLSLTPEQKERRKRKIQKVYADGKHDALFERYSTERRGSNNPAAKAITLNGIYYPSIKDAMITLNKTRSQINNLRKKEDAKINKN